MDGIVLVNESMESRNKKGGVGAANSWLARAMFGVSLCSVSRILWDKLQLLM